MFEETESGCSWEALADLKKEEAVTSAPEGSATRLVLLRGFVWSKEEESAVVVVSAGC